MHTLAKKRTNANVVVDRDSYNDNALGARSNSTHLYNRNRSSGDSSSVPFFPSLFGQSSSDQRRSSRMNRRSGNCNTSSTQTLSLDEIEALLSEKVKMLSNTRPRASLVVHRRDNGNEFEDESSPVFDGAVANSTPLGSHSGGGGTGTILHLACALDSPFALMVLLVMGAEASCRHTAFRRLILHESAASDSPKCVKLLLEMGTQFFDELEGSGIQGTTFSYTPKWKRTDLKAGSKIKRKSFALSASSWSHDGAKKSNCARTASFVGRLRICLDLAEQLKHGTITHFDAANSLLQKVSVSDTNKYVIASTCQVGHEDFNSTDGHGNTALHWAAFKNSTSCCQLLIEKGSSPNAVAKTSGWTPLHDAAYSDSNECLSLLISAGADVNAKANSGATPLCFAAQEDGPNSTRILLAAGADPTARCCDENNHNDPNSLEQHLNRFSGYTPLHYCGHYNAHHAARVLLEYHNDVLVPTNKSLLTVSDLNDRLAIHVAVARGSSDVLRELLHFGARVETDRNRSSSMSIQNDDQSASSTASGDEPMENEGLAIVRSQSFDTQMADERPQPTSPNPQSAIITPVSSPVLRSMIPAEPIDSPKPWNCISQRSIDECKMLIQEAELNWSPARHKIFHPRDRAAVIELLRVGKRLEQIGTGIFIDLWPLVLSFCCRGWFEPDEAELPTFPLQIE